MGRFKQIATTLTVMAMLGAGGAAYAATTQTPAEIAAGLTGKSIQTLQQERSAGKTYGTIANEAGKLEQFKAQMLEQKKQLLQERVANGTLTQERADAFLARMQDCQSDCDGTEQGQARMGRAAGLGFGAGQGNGQGNGPGAGNGNGVCDGTGVGAGNGLNQ